jgi:hypothetical protein
MTTKENDIVSEIICPNSVMADLLSDTENILKTVPAYNLISQGNKFKDIKAYGSNDNPLFKSKCIFNYIQHQLFIYDTNDPVITKTALKTISQKYYRWVKEIKELLTEGMDYDYVKRKLQTKKVDGVKNNENMKETYLFTEMGLLTVLCNPKNKSELSSTFRRHIIKYIRNIKKYHEEVHDQERERSKNELIINLQQKLGDACHRIDDLEISNCYNQKISVVLDKFESYSEYDDLQGNKSSKEAAVLKEMYMKKIDVYVVDINYLHPHLKNKNYDHTDEPTKKKIKKILLPRKRNSVLYEDISDSDDDVNINDKIHNTNIDNLDYEYDIPHTGINIHDLKNDKSEDLLYFHIQGYTAKPKTTAIYHKVSEIYVKDKIHYDDMIKDLSCLSNKSNKPNILKCSYSNILDSNHRTLLHGKNGNSMFRILNNSKFHSF